MKKTSGLLLLLGLIILSSQLISCKADSPVENNGNGNFNDYFQWTVVDSSSYIFDLYLGDAENIFAAGPGIAYKISNGVKTELINEPEFSINHIYGYNKDYVVFSMRLYSPWTEYSKLKIYSNGTMTEYVDSNYRDADENFLILDPGKFIYQNSSFSFTLSQNGIKSQYSMPDTSYINKIFKLNNSIYIFSNKRVDTTLVYKFEDNQVRFQQKDAVPVGRLTQFNSEIFLTASYLGNPGFISKITYFNGTSWNQVAAAFTSGNYHFHNISGESPNFITGICKADTGSYKIRTYNGSLMYEQNFPIPVYPTAITLMSNYKDNTVYIYADAPRPCLIKGKRIRF